MILTENIDSRPYTGTRKVNGELKLKERETLKKHGCSDKMLDKIVKKYHLMFGCIYKITNIEGFGDCEDVTVLNEFGSEVVLADFFFEEIDKR